MKLDREALLRRGAQWAPWAGLGLLYLTLLGPEVIEVDAAQYASMAREMLERGRWLTVEHRGEPYLDKPPLLFWLSALSMAAFGMSTWAYKLPTLLAFIGALVATYRYAALWHGARVGRAAALMLGANLGAVLLINDVRTDGLLLAAVIGALWQWSEYLKSGRTASLAWGWALAALAMLAKGPIGLMAPLLGIGSHLVLTGRWRELIRPRVWLLGVGIVGALLAPMLWGLWQQYGAEGWRFYFYTQSFGRLTGDNTVWNNDGGLSAFFVHTFAYTILPWTLPFAIGLGRQVAAAARWRLGEWVTLAGFVLPFVALSFSRYKLPHYIYVVLPLGAVLAGQGLIWLLDAAPRGWRRFGAGFQLVLVGLLWALVLTLGLWAWPVGHLGVGMLLTLTLVATVTLALTRGYEGRVVWAPMATLVAVGLLMSLHLYPSWLLDQSATQAAHAYRREPAGRPPLVQLHTRDHSLEFYTQQIVPRVDLGEAKWDSLLALPQVWWYTDASGRDSLRRQGGVRVERELALPHYPIQLMTGRYLDPAQRPRARQTRYLLLLERTAADSLR